MTKQYKTCQDAFDAAAIDRKNYPLNHGEYKLREVRNTISGWKKELIQITAFKKDKTKRHGLTHCTADDAGYWLKGLLEMIAHELGYNVLPSIAALIADGVPNNTVGSLLHQATQRSLRLVGQCESASKLLSQGVSEEYKRMKAGQSSIEPILDQILALIDTVLAAAGLVSSQPKPQPKPQQMTQP